MVWGRNLKTAYGSLSPNSLEKSSPVHLLSKCRLALGSGLETGDCVQVWLEFKLSCSLGHDQAACLEVPRAHFSHLTYEGREGGTITKLLYTLSLQPAPMFHDSSFGSIRLNPDMSHLVKAPRRGQKTSRNCEQIDSCVGLELNSWVSGSWRL